MKPTIETGDDMVTVISEPGALTFATRKEWQELPESRLCELQSFETIRVFKGTESVYFLLRNMNPIEYIEEKRGISCKLVRVTSDEDGKPVVYAMNLALAEGHQLCRSQLTVWE